MAVMHARDVGNVAMRHTFHANRNQKKSLAFARFDEHTLGACRTLALMRL